MAMPMPPPMHKVARPLPASRLAISCSNVIKTRARGADLRPRRAGDDHVHHAMLLGEKGRIIPALCDWF